MTLSELVDDVHLWTGEQPSDATIITLLNRDQETLVTMLRFPQEFGEITTTGEFILPNGPTSADLLEVRSTDGVKLPIYTVEQANERIPDWADLSTSDTPLAIVFDPKVRGADVRPVPLPTTSITLQVLYVARPPAMTDMTSSVPFDGMFPELHRVLSLRVASDILLARGDAKFQVVQQKADQLLGQLMSYAKLRQLQTKNPLWKGVWGA